MTHDGRFERSRKFDSAIYNIIIVIIKSLSRARDKNRLKAFSNAGQRFRKNRDGNDLRGRNVREPEGFWSRPV